jgi:hypothetical protein
MGDLPVEVEALVSAVDGLAGLTPLDLPDGPLLSSADALLRQRNRIDAALNRVLSAMDSKESTVTLAGGP